ncbi:MAG: glycosyltransferase family 39 protein [Candidatus Hydrogenedentes bacterium]|nr:glycosyltransferase family 39 protein [Candidatus Hydrogenedentota bacterium]
MAVDYLSAQLRGRRRSLIHVLCVGAQLWKRNATIFIAFAVAFVVRFGDLNAKGLWYDEAMAALAARNVGIGNVLDALPLPPFYLFVIKVFTIFGDEAYLLRLPSAFFGILTVALVGFMAWRMEGVRAAHLALTITAICPFLVFYSRDAKMYAWLGFFQTASLCSLILYSRSNGAVRYLLCYVVTSLALAHVHLLGGFFIATTSIVFFLVRLCSFVSVRKWLWTQAILALLCLPNIYFMYLRFVDMRSLEFWAPQPTPVSLYFTLTNFFAGYVVSDHTRALTAIGAVILVAGGLAASTRNRRELLFLLLAAAFPVLAFYGLSAVHSNSIYVDRFLIGSAPPLLIIAAVGLSPIGSMWKRAAMLLLVLTIQTLGLFDQFHMRLPADGRKAPGVFNTFPTPKIIAFMRENIRPDDLILHTNRMSCPEFMWHLPEVQNTIIDIGGNVGSLYARRGTEKELKLFDISISELDTVALSERRAWVIAPAPGAYGYGNANPEILPWLNERAACVTAKSFGDIYYPTWVYLFDSSELARDNPATKLNLPRQPSILGSDPVPSEVSLHWECAAAAPVDGAHPARTAVTLLTQSESDRPQSICVSAFSADGHIGAARFVRTAAPQTRWELRTFRDRRSARLAMHYRVDSSVLVGADQLVCATSLPPGTYSVFVERITNGVDYPAHTAAFSLQLDGNRLIVPGTLEGSPGGWQWIRIGSHTVEHLRDTQAILSLLSHRADSEAFVSFSQIVFVNTDDAAEKNTPAIWEKHFEIGPRQVTESGLDLFVDDWPVYLFLANERYSTLTRLAPSFPSATKRRS